MLPKGFTSIEAPPAIPQNDEQEPLGLTIFNAFSFGLRGSWTTDNLTQINFIKNKSY